MTFLSYYNVIEKVHVGNNQEKAQSERTEVVKTKLTIGYPH